MPSKYVTTSNMHDVSTSHQRIVSEGLSSDCLVFVELDVRSLAVASRTRQSETE